MEHAAVQRAEMEFADDERLVHGARIFEIRDIAAVEVVADDVAVLSGGFGGDVVDPCEAAARVELMRRDGFQCVADRAEIRFGEFGVERAEVVARLCFVRSFAGFEHGVP